MAVSIVPIAPGRYHHRPAGDRAPLAPKWFPRLLALEIPPRLSAAARSDLISRHRRVCADFQLRMDPERGSGSANAVDRANPICARLCWVRGYSIRLRIYDRAIYSTWARHYCLFVGLTDIEP